MLSDFDHIWRILTDPLFFAGVSLAAGFLVMRYAFLTRPFLRAFCRLAFFAFFTVMLAIAGVSPLEPTSATVPTIRYVVASGFKIFWWFAASWLLVGFLRALVVLKRLPKQTRFLQDLLAGLVYLSAGSAIISYVFDMPIRGLLAASGVIAVVLGLALQSTLGDAFSGFVLNVARPYHPGDWIILDGDLQGRVVETNWRATQLITANHDLAVVPNSVIAKGKIINASEPAKMHGATIVVRLESPISPSHGCGVLQTALLGSNRILQIPAASVTVRAVDAMALECELQFFVAAFENVIEAKNELFDLAFRHCTSAGIRLASPPGSPTPLLPRPAHPTPAEAARRLLEHLPIFTALTDEQRAALAPKFRGRTYRDGDLLKAGVVSEALFVLTSGVLVAQREGSTEAEEVIRFGPGDYFGESGLLAGPPMPFKIVALTKATVFEITKSDLEPLLKQRPAIAGDPGQMLALDQAAEDAGAGSDVVQDGHGENLAVRLADRVRALFSLIPAAIETDRS
jgi:small-conductance mechanosensitive channel